MKLTNWCLIAEPVEAQWSVEACSFCVRWERELTSYFTFISVRQAHAPGGLRLHILLDLRPGANISKNIVDAAKDIIAIKAGILDKATKQQMGEPNVDIYTQDKLAAVTQKAGKQFHGMPEH